MTTGGVYLIYDGTNIPTISSRRITGLVSGHLYAYEVSGLNRVGEGPRSPISQEFYSAKLPGRPEAPKVDFASGTQIGLQLTALSDNGGSRILNYKLYVDDGDIN